MRIVPLANTLSRSALSASTSTGLISQSTGCTARDDREDVRLKAPDHRRIKPASDLPTLCSKVPLRLNGRDIQRAIADSRMNRSPPVGLMKSSPILNSDCVPGESSNQPGHSRMATEQWGYRIAMFSYVKTSKVVTEYRQSTSDAQKRCH